MGRGVWRGNKCGGFQSTYPPKQPQAGGNERSQNGRTLISPSPDLYFDLKIYSDAQPEKWGAFHPDEAYIGGRWSNEEENLHINPKELLAALFAVKPFAKGLVDKHIHIFSDNTSAASYINNLGGTQSQALIEAAKKF
ncbi:unnamed protein product [Didymodactylos carnosus]|uniref:Reverse transcriptase RNase H-like domain-containing protein n=1 Tax=Didymodactylos carnosus TaxID=1234261 RepID=A0A8S2SDA4_9BILA|nr:unnamed protein product [Didymodactylos carnosus]CAF4222825.1 unnamed protein product [Didymodactylos carnosus]